MDIDAKGLVEIFFVERLRRSGQQHGRVIHQNVQALEFRDRGCNQLFHVFAPAHVGGHRQACGADLPRRALQLGRIASGNHHPCAFAHERLGNGFADPAAPAGDDGRFICQTHEEDCKSRAPSANWTGCPITTYSGSY